MANATVEISGTSAEEAAAAGAGELSVGSSSEIATTISTPAFASCPAGATGCGGSAGPPQADLTIGASADEVLDAAQIILDGVGASEAPGISQAAEIINITIDAGRGDYVSVGLGAISLLPIAGAAASAAKISKRLGKAADLGGKVKYIGRLEDLKDISRSQTLLDELPNLGSPRANYYQNASILRKNIRDGFTIRDASSFRPNSELAPTKLRPGRTIGQTFLGAERLLLKNRGLLR